MGAQTKLDIETEKLTGAAGKAGETLAASAPKPVPPPPLTTTSALDAALVLVSTSSETLRTTVDTTDTTWATKQQAALTESPPILQQQDTQAAGDYQRSSQFPMPAVKPPGGPPDVTGIRPASFTPPPEGPWGLDPDEWELDQFGSPQPIWPTYDGGGGAAAGGAHAGTGTGPTL